METLRDRFLQCQQAQAAGHHAGELVDYIRAAAEILDYLYQQHSVQHLGLNPRKLVLDKGWLQLAEFGLAQLVWLPSGQDIAQRNVRYAAPELFQRQVSRSAAISTAWPLIYAEMLTGQHPFHGQDPRHRLEPGPRKTLGPGPATSSRGPCTPTPPSAGRAPRKWPWPWKGTHPEVAAAPAGR